MALCCAVSAQSKAANGKISTTLKRLLSILVVYCAYPVIWILTEVVQATLFDVSLLKS